jgi:hypothetical protein
MCPKKISIITLFLLVLAAPYSHAGMEDRGDRLSSGQSSVFSPGYINATMQKTKEIINQVENNKNPLEMRSRAMENKLSNKVDEDSADKPKLDLKKKTGGGESKPAGAAVKTKNGTVNTVSIQQYMDEQVAQNTLNLALGETYTSGAATLANGNMVVWNVQNDANNEVLIKNSGGSTIAVVPGAIEGDSYNSINGVTDIGNGRFVMSVTGAEYGGGPQDGALYVYNYEGVLQNSVVYNNRDYDVHYSMPGGIVSLGDGNMATLMYESGVDFEDGAKRCIRVMDSNLNVIKDISVGTNNFYGDSIVALSSGGLAVMTQDDLMNSCIFTVLDKDFNETTSFSMPSLAYNYSDAGKQYYGRDAFGQIVSTGDNSFAVGWFHQDTVQDQSTGQHVDDCQMRVDTFKVDFEAGAVYEKNSVVVGSASNLDVYHANYSAIGSIVGLNNGSVVILSRAGTDFDADGGYKASLGLLTSEGELVNIPLGLENGISPGIIERIVPLGNDNFAALYRDASGWNRAAEQFTLQGTPRNVADNQSYSVTIPNLSGAVGYNFSTSISGPYGMSGSMIHQDDNYGKAFYAAMLEPKDAPVLQGEGFEAFKNMLQGGLAESAPGNRIVRDALAPSGIIMVPEEITGVNALYKLAAIINNPTEDQKLMLSSVEALLKDVKNIENQSNSPELKKASDDLVQAVAAILLAQAVPDLLKGSEATEIKGIFKDLDAVKDNIMFEYNESVKPYYDEMKKLISKNMAMLQLSSIVSKAMIDDKLSPSEIDKILEKLRRASKRSFDEEYILQQEAKYHKQYVDPNKKLLEEKLRDMMRNFTQKLSGVLESAKTAKK